MVARSPQLRLACVMPLLAQSSHASCSPAQAISLQDPHTTLGVEPGADEQSVRKAYRKLALKCAPPSICCCAGARAQGGA